MGLECGWRHAQKRWSWEFENFEIFLQRILYRQLKLSKKIQYVIAIHLMSWTIFMISGLNEQPQQELDYTQVKPGEFQKVQSDTLEERYAIKFCFKLGKKATETYGMLQTAYQQSCINQASVFEWHKRLKEVRESLRDDQRCGRSKFIKTPKLIGQKVRVRIKVTMLRF